MVDLVKCKWSDIQKCEKLATESLALGSKPWLNDFSCVFTGYPQVARVPTSVWWQTYTVFYQVCFKAEYFVLLLISFLVACRNSCDNDNVDNIDNNSNDDEDDDDDDDDDDDGDDDGDDDDNDGNNINDIECKRNTCIWDLNWTIATI